MNETTRTLVFVVVGAVAALGAYASRPNTQEERLGVNELVGDPLFKGFTDPTLARSLEIKQFDEATARAKTFTVAQQPSGRWVIPSHGGYPADAESQLKAVAETLSDLKIIGVASEVATDHGLYGVLDPDKAEVGAAGIGTLLAMQDNKGNDLLRLIVGKEVQGATNQRFVRKPTEEVVYVTTVDMTKLPTEFEKWIEKDLLKINTFDVSRVILKDYVLLPTQTGGMGLLPRMDATLTYDSSKGQDAWQLAEMLVHSRQGPRPSALGDLEELNNTKLDELRNALGDVKIIDVVRKPGDLGNSLQVSQDKLTREQQDALRDFGFYPNPAAGGKLDIYGANGEVRIDTKDGVEYVLRFGDIAPQAELSSTTSSSAGDAEKNEEEQLKINRYLFVMAQLAPAVLTPPQLEPVPAGPEAPEKPAEAEKKEQAKADEAQAEAQPAVVDPQQAERERIKKENQRKLDEYNDKKRKAETRVAELNSRFADWYYVVSEDVYKKIRLVRSDFVKEAATAKDEGFGVDAFRKLEEEGPKGPKPAATPAAPASPASPFGP